MRIICASAHLVHRVAACCIVCCSVLQYAIVCCSVLVISSSAQSCDVTRMNSLCCIYHRVTLHVWYIYIYIYIYIYVVSRVINMNQYVWGRKFSWVCRSLMQCLAMCCSVLQCVAVYYKCVCGPADAWISQVTHRSHIWISVDTRMNVWSNTCKWAPKHVWMRRVAVCCNELQCVAVCYKYLSGRAYACISQVAHVNDLCDPRMNVWSSTLKSVLLHVRMRRVAVCCSVLQCVAVFHKYCVVSRRRSDCVTMYNSSLT